jgi:hypothetical protein
MQREARRKEKQGKGHGGGVEHVTTFLVVWLFCLSQRFPLCRRATRKDALESPAVICRLAFHDVKVGAGQAADGPIPAIADARVEVARVKRLKITVERREVLHGGVERERQSGGRTHCETRSEAENRARGREERREVRELRAAQRFSLYLSFTSHPQISYPMKKDVIVTHSAKHRETIREYAREREREREKKGRIQTWAPLLLSLFHSVCLVARCKADLHLVKLCGRLCLLETHAAGEIANVAKDEEKTIVEVRHEGDPQRRLLKLLWDSQGGD